MHPDAAARRHGNSPLPAVNALHGLIALSCLVIGAAIGFTAARMLIDPAPAPAPLTVILSVEPDDPGRQELLDELAERLRDSGEGAP